MTSEASLHPKPLDEPRSSITWRDLEPDPRIVRALAHAGTRPIGGSQQEKRHWSELFAHASAVAFADELRLIEELRDKTITPTDIGAGSEKIIPLGSGVSKRVDVTVVDRILGLEIGMSLKGLNFRDTSGNQYDKNLTGRLYELGDEMRLVHEYLPRAFMVGVFFLPLASVSDKTARADSSFARTVIALRDRSGRLDPSLSGQAVRCDAAFVALYSTGEESEHIQPGVVRLFDVRAAPPRRGRPKVRDTVTIAEACRAVVAMATHAGDVVWSEPEPDA